MKSNWMACAFYGLCFLAVPCWLLADSPQTAPAASDAYSRGFALYQQKQYSQAISLLEKAVLENPGSSQAYYYLAYCQYLTQDQKNAALNFYLTDQTKPSPAIRAFADQVKSKLSPEDQRWVEEKLAPSPSPSPETFLVRPTPAPTPEPTLTVTPQGSLEAQFGKFGLRFSVEAFILNMDDFKTEGNSISAYADYQKGSDPSIGYEQSLPGLTSSLEVNPYFALGDFEIGGRFSYLLMNTAKYEIHDAFGYEDKIHMDFDTFSTEIVGRYYLRTGEGTSFFFEPSLGYQPMRMDFSISYQGASGLYSSGKYGFITNGSTLNAGLKLGFKFQTKGSASFSLSAGYEYARVNNLHGTFYDDHYPNRNLPGSAVLIYDEYSNTDSIWFVPDDASQNNLYYNTPTDLQRSRPLVVDLSGFRANADMSILF